MDQQIPQTTLEKLHRHAAAAARVIGHPDDPIAVGRLGDHIDEISQLAEPLGEPHPIAAPVLRVSSLFDDQPTQVHSCSAGWIDSGTARIEAAAMAELVESGER